MTREEQRRVRELKKPLETACRAAGKRRGWKTIAGRRYQVRDGILYILYVSLPPSGCGRTLKANLRCKPVALDEMYWEVFHMAEEALGQPFSFHVNGAFTVPGLWLPSWEEPLPAPEVLEPAVEAVFDRAEALAAENAFFNLADYRACLKAENRPHQTLEIILCLLCEGNCGQAMKRAEEGLARGESGGFLRDGGRRSILEDVRDYCAARMAGTPWAEERLTEERI